MNSRIGVKEPRTELKGVSQYRSTFLYQASKSIMTTTTIMRLASFTRGTPTLPAASKSLRSVPDLAINTQVEQTGTAHKHPKAFISTGSCKALRKPSTLIISLKFERGHKLFVEGNAVAASPRQGLCNLVVSAEELNCITKSDFWFMAFSPLYSGQSKRYQALVQCIQCT